jgi:hypothetical protein
MVLSQQAQLRLGGAYKCVYVSLFLHRGIFFRPLAFDSAKPGLMNMFPLTWTSLSAIVVTSNTSSAPKATPTVDLGYGLRKATINACILPSIGRLHH